MNQFGKFQRISSSFDPENPLMDVGNDSGILTHLSGDIQLWKTIQIPLMFKELIFRKLTNYFRAQKKES